MTLILGVQQIAHSLAVDFHVGDLNSVAERTIRVGFNSAEKLVAGEGYNATVFTVSHLSSARTNGNKGPLSFPCTKVLPVGKKKQLRSM